MGDQQATARGENVLYELGKDAPLFPKRRKYLHWYLVGIVDGEGCFSVSVKKQQNTRFGYVIDPVFHVVQGERGIAVLKALKQVLSAGRIEQKHGQDEWQFIVDNRRQLKEKVIPFFNKHPLIIKKQQFELFADIVERMERKEHWNKEGFINLLKLTYKLTSGNRKRSLEEVLKDMRRESSETIRQGPSEKGE